jgi:hypothetical protein
MEPEVDPRQQDEEEYLSRMPSWQKMLIMIGMLSVMGICCVYPAVIFVIGLIRGSQ